MNNKIQPTGRGVGEGKVNRWFLDLVSIVYKVRTMDGSL